MSTAPPPLSRPVAPALPPPLLLPPPTLETLPADAAPSPLHVAACPDVSAAADSRSRMKAALCSSVDAAIVSTHQINASVHAKQLPRITHIPIESH